MEGREPLECLGEPAVQGEWVSQETHNSSRRSSIPPTWPLTMVEDWDDTAPMPAFPAFEGDTGLIGDNSNQNGVLYPEGSLGRMPLGCVQEHPSEDLSYEEAVTSFTAAPPNFFNGTAKAQLESFTDPKPLQFVDTSYPISHSDPFDSAKESDCHHRHLNSGSPREPSGSPREPTEEGTDLLPQLTSTKGGKSRPGVVLLGRGNSFSLGRSEVILLHGRGDHRLRSKATAPSPPPISTNGDHASHGEELERLWRQAETIMAARTGQVHTVLHDFGIGQESGGEEEEDVWRVVQDQLNR